MCRKYGLWTKKWDDRTCALMGQNYILIFTGDLYAGLEVAYLRRDADGDLRLWDLTQYLRMEISDRDRKKTITVKTITDQWKRDTVILSRLLGRRFKNLLSGGSTWMCSFFRSPHMRMGLRRSDELMPKAANYLTHKKTGNPDMRVFWAQVCFKNVCKKYPVKLAKLTDKALLLKGEDYGLAFVVEDNVVCVCYFRREDGMKVWNVTGYLAQAVGESAWNPIAGRHELVNKNVFLLLARVLQEQFADLLAGGCVWMLDYQNSAYYQPPNDTVKHNEVD